MNTKLFGLFIALLVCLPSLAQQKPVEKVDSDGVYLMPDQMPEFPGGMQAMMKFLTTNIKYPVEAQKKGVSGFHFGINFTTRKASSSSKGSIPLTTLA